MIEKTLQHCASDSDAIDSDPIATELHCLNCDYNLITLSPSGVCPECGTAIQQTLDVWQRSGFRHSADAPRARRLLYLLATTLALMFLIQLFEPFRQATDSYWAASWSVALRHVHFVGDHVAVCVMLIVSYMALIRTFSFLPSEAASKRVLFLKRSTIQIAGCLFLALTVIAFGVDLLIWLKGFRATEVMLGRTLFTSVTIFRLSGGSILRTFALACLAGAALLLCASLAQTTSRDSTSRRYSLASGVICASLLLCGLYGVLHVSVRFLGSVFWLSFSNFLQKGFDSVATLATGTTALLVFLYAQTVTPAAPPVVMLREKNVSGLGSRVQSVVNAAIWQAYAALLAAWSIGSTFFISSLESWARSVVGAVAHHLFIALALACLMLIIGMEIIVDLRLDRVKPSDHGRRRALRAVLKYRLAIWAGFLFMFGMQFSPVVGSWELGGPFILIGGMLLVLFIRVSHRMLACLRALVGDNEPQRPAWFEPLGATVFGGLIMLYFVLMEAMRGGMSRGPTEVFMFSKLVLTYAISAVAICAFAAAAANARRVRREVSIEVRTFDEPGIVASTELPA